MTASASAAAPTTIFLRTRLIDSNGATAEFLTVECADCFARRIVIAHLDEAEATGPAGLAIGDECDFANIAVLAEQFAELAFGGLERKISNVEFHLNSPMCPRKLNRTGSSGLICVGCVNGGDHLVSRR